MADAPGSLGLTKATTIGPSVKDAYRQAGENAFQTEVPQGLDAHAMEMKRRTANSGTDIPLPRGKSPLEGVDTTPRQPLRKINGIHTAATKEIP